MQNYWYGGTGFNYSVFNKEVPDIPSEIRFSSFKPLSLKLGANKEFNERWRWDSSLLVAPGATKDGTRVNVSKGDYYWTILSSDALYSRDNWKSPWRGYRLRYGFRGGLQAHNLPFIVSQSIEDNTQTVEMKSLFNTMVGGHLDIITDDEFSYEMYFRMALPMLHSSSIKMNNFFAFDGSLGALYKKKDKPYGFGLYWYGQWLNFSFEEFDKFADKEVSGKFNILYSNIEFRMTYDF